MRRFLFLAVMVVVILSTSCASKRSQPQGGTTDLYGRSTEAGMGRLPASRYPYQHHDGYEGYSAYDADVYGE